MGYVGALHEPALHRYAGLKDDKPNNKKLKKYNEEAQQSTKTPTHVNSDGHHGRLRKKFKIESLSFLTEELSIVIIWKANAGKIYILKSTVAFVN